MADFSIEYKNYLDLIKDPAYLELYEYYSSETIMGILGVDRQENPHSSFIRWLLDMNGDHGYGSAPMRKLLETVCLFKEKVYTDPDTHELRKQGLWSEKKNLLNSCNEQAFLDEIKFGRYEITKQIIATEQVLSGQRRADIFSILKLEGSAFKEKKPLYLLIVIENKVHSTEHTDQTKAYANSLKESKDINKILKKVENKTGQDWVTKEIDADKNLLMLLVYLNAFPTRDIKGYLASEEAVLKKNIIPIAGSEEFITLNYQYLLDGVIDPLAITSNGKQKERMNEYIRCLGQAKISPSDESSSNKNDEYLIMAVSSREKKLALSLWNNSNYREVIYGVLNSYFDQNEEFALRKRDTVFWGSLANLYRFIGEDIPDNESLDAIASKQDLLELVRTDNGARIIRKFIYNHKGEDIEYISYKHPSLGLLFRDIVNDYIQSLGSDVKRQEDAIKELNDYYHENGSWKCDMFMYEKAVKDLPSRRINSKMPASVTQIDYIDDFANAYFSYLRPDGTNKKRNFKYKYDIKDPKCLDDDDLAIKLVDGTKAFVWRFWQVDEIYALIGHLKEQGYIVEGFKEIT